MPRDAPSIPHLIHRVWLGGPMPEEFVRFGQEWERLHPGWTVKTWREADLTWLTNADVFADATLFSSRSNVARYEILLREGGVYVDCDMEPLRNIEPLLEGAPFVSAFELAESQGNAFLAAVPGHPILQRLVAEVPASHYSQPEASSPIRTGPRLLNRAIRRTPDPDGTVRRLPREVAYPYNWNQSHLRRARFDEAWMVHHCAGSWWRPAPRRRITKAGLVRRARRLRELALRPWTRRTMLALGDNRLLVETAYGFQILAFADDLSTTPVLVRSGIHDQAFAAFIEREMRAGDVFVDVGANIGLMTIHAARRSTITGRVLAFEANPECAAMLEDSLYMNRMQGAIHAQVEVRNVAVGAEPGTAQLHIPTRHRGRASLRPANVPDADRSTVTVEVVALDPLLRGIPEVRIVKVDVEGAELQVLRGLRQTLADRRIRLLDLELRDVLAGETWDELVALLRELSATATSTFTIDPDGTRRPMTVDAAVHQDALSHFVLAFE